MNNVIKLNNYPPNNEAKYSSLKINTAEQEWRQIKDE